MSTTRCATILLALVRGRIVPAALTVLNILLDNSNLVIAIVFVAAEIVVVLSSQTRPVAGHAGPARVVTARREERSYRATYDASSACTS